MTDVCMKCEGEFKPYGYNALQVLCDPCADQVWKSPEWEALGGTNPTDDDCIAAVTAWCERTKCYRCGAHTENVGHTSGAPWCESCKKQFHSSQPAIKGDFVLFTQKCPLKITWLGPRWRPPISQENPETSEEAIKRVEPHLDALIKLATSSQPTCARCGTTEPGYAFWRGGTAIACKTCIDEYQHLQPPETLEKWAAAHRTHELFVPANQGTIIPAAQPHDCGQPLCTWRGSSWCREIQ